jgi:hypothetical protein
VIQNTAENDFRRLGLSLERVSSDALSLGRATNAGTVVASADDVSALPTLGGWYESWASTTDALSPEVVDTFWRL